jgi:hypothetical protein
MQRDPEETHRIERYTAMERERHYKVHGTLHTTHSKISYVPLRERAPSTW